MLCTYYISSKYCGFFWGNKWNYKHLKKKKTTKNKFYTIPSDYSALLEFFPVHHEDKKELSREMEWSQKKHKSSCENFFSSESESEVAQLCPTLCYPVDCSPPGSSIHRILQARILERVAISFSKRSSWPRDRTQVSHIAGRRFNLWATREVPNGY